MYFDEFDVGFKVELPPIKIEKEKMIAFAEEYDRIPLHTDEEYAKTTMFKDLIASGFYSALIVYGEFTKDHIWQGGHIVGNLAKFEFLKPVFAGDTLRGVMSITSKKQIDDKRGVMEEKIEIYNQDDVLVLIMTSNKFMKMSPK